MRNFRGCSKTGVRVFLVAYREAAWNFTAEFYLARTGDACQFASIAGQHAPRKCCYLPAIVPSLASKPPSMAHFLHVHANP